MVAESPISAYAIAQANVSAQGDKRDFGFGGGVSKEVVAVGSTSADQAAKVE